MADFPAPPLPQSTVLSALRWAADVLKRGRIDESRLSAELLLCHLLDCERIRLYLDFDKILRRDELDRFVALIRRRLAHEPVQYIVGEAHFMGLGMFVDGRVLIPRPETEILVEEMLFYARRRGSSPMTILDVGAGSGNIAVALAHYLPHVRVVGLDVSAGALEVAAENVARHGLGERVTLVRCDITGKGLPFREHSFHAVVSNPPYIPAAEIGALDPEVRNFEPDMATTDGADGLTFFRTLAATSRRLLEPGGVIMVETAFNQARLVEQIFREQAIGELRIISDLSGIERIVRGVRGEAKVPSSADTQVGR
jgi:release factor glutamine methyltransferase